MVLKNQKIGQSAKIGQNREKSLFRKSKREVFLK